jgi:hypothetical protein
MRRALLFAGLVPAAGAVVLAGFLVLFPVPGPSPPPPVVEPAPPGGPDEPAPVGMADISGVVVDEEGLPISGAEVYLLAPGSRVIPTAPPERVRTDGAGCFALRRPLADEPDLVAVAWGRRPALVPSAPIGAGHRITLARGGSLAGAVEDDLGRPVAGATVIVRSEGVDLTPERGIWLPCADAVVLSYGRALTGPAGEFRVGGLGGEELEVRVEKAGYPPPAGFSGPVRAGGERARFVLPRPFVAEVVVFDADSGRPLPGVAVEVRVAAEGPPVFAKGRTGVGGLFRGAMPFPAEGAADLPATVGVFSDRRGGVVQESVPLRAVAEGAGYRIALSVRDPGTLRVTVMRDDGTPEPNWAMLRLGAPGGAEVVRWTSLGPEGTGEIEVPPGRYDSAGVEAGRSFGLGRGAVQPGVLEVTPGSTTDLKFVLPRGADLEIRSPVGGAHATVEVRLGDQCLNLTSWGRIELPDLPPGAVKVTFSSEGAAPLAKTVTLVKGEKTTLTFP